MQVDEFTTMLLEIHDKMTSTNKNEVSKLFLISLCVSVLTFRKCIFQNMEVDLSCYLAIHWYLLDTILGYTLRIELTRVYARFWNQFITSNWLPHHHFLVLAPLSVNFTGQFTINSSSHGRIFLFPLLLMSFLFSGNLFRP